MPKKALKEFLFLLILLPVAILMSIANFLFLRNKNRKNFHDDWYYE